MLWLCEQSKYIDVFVGAECEQLSTKKYYIRKNHWYVEYLVQINKIIGAQNYQAKTMLTFFKHTVLLSIFENAANYHESF